MSRITSPVRRFAAGMAAVTLTATGLVSASFVAPITAHAAPTGALTIHKYLSETSVAPTTDGTQATNVPADAKRLSGVCFGLQKVDYATAGGTKIDLVNNPQSWKDIQGLKAPVDEALIGPVNANYKQLGGCTDANGTINWGGLEPGLYQVTEWQNNPSAQIVNADGTTSPLGGQLNASAPFLVTLPMGMANNVPNYDVHVYPKNTLRGVRKSVQDAGKFNISDRITYTIDADVKPTTTAGELTRLTIVDDFDERKFIMGPGDIKVEAFKGATPIALDAADYTLTFDDQIDHLKVDFTRAGLDKLGAQALNARDVVVRVTATPAMQFIGVTDGIIPNQAQLVDDNGTVYSNTVQTKRSYLRMLKTNEAGAPLGGAVFELWSCKGDTPATMQKIEAKYDDLAHTTVSRYTTNGAGEFTIDGAVWSSFANNAEQVAANQIKYCFYEVQAPSGYQPLTEPVVATIDSTTVQNPDTYPLVVVKAVNYPNNVPMINIPLPNTGGMGVIALIGGGAAVATAGVVANRRRRG